MGMALWKQIDADEAVEVPEYLPPPEAGCRYRIETLGRPRSPWRGSPAEAMADALALDLASWDATAREHFLAVPVEIRVVRAVPSSAI